MQEQVYKTEAGDTWDLIAFKLFGNENLMQELLEENIELSEIVIFPAGVELSIPEIKEDKKRVLALFLLIRMLNLSIFV